MSYRIRKFLLLNFSYIKFLYYSLSTLLIKNSPNIKTESKSLLIIKLDEIGDYILFRNLIKYFRSSEKYKDYKITICGNIAWKDIFDYLDKDYVDSSFWINKDKFSKNLFYRQTILKLIVKGNYETVINCSLSRIFFNDDALVQVSNAKFKFGSVTDLNNQFLWQKKISSNYYSELFDIKDQFIFEYQRNKEFISTILNTQIPQLVPLIKKEIITNNISVKERYVVFSLGGRKNYKIWNVANFITVAKHIKEKYNLKFVLVGASADIKNSKVFENNFNEERVIDYTAKTNLIEVMKILSNAELMLTNDSGLAHIAAALSTKVIVIANGTHYGRFFPYPDESKNIKTIYPLYIENNFKSFNELASEFKIRSMHDINSISTERVIKEVEIFLG